MKSDSVLQTPISSAEERKRIRVLVIDDNDAFRQLIMDILEPERFEVVAIANPLTALELFSRETTRFDLVLLDYYMPHLDGTKTFEWLRKLNPKVKVIICSGAEVSRLQQIAKQHKVNGVIHKPFHLTEVVDLIEKVLNQPV